MNKEKGRVPKLRFPGFTEDWEQRKLGDITKTNPFKSYLSNALEIGKYEVIQQGEIPIAGYADGIPCYNYENITIFGDHTLSLFKPNKPFFISSDGVKLLSPLVKIDGQFFYYLLEKYKPKSEGYKRHFTILKNCEAYFPNNIEEQTKISTLLNRINSIITLHQRKLEHLNLKKKALLQKLFPKNGERYPEIRFPGFTDAWEQRKLGDLAEIVRGASPRPISDPKWFDNNSKVGWLRIADVTAQDGRIRYLEQKISELGQEKTRVIKTPHLLLSIAATVGKPVINYVPTGVHDGFLIFLNPKFNILFTFWWLEMFREKWNKYGQPGSQVNLNSDLVKNQVINIPNEKEQEEISSFLEALDKIITLHQRKLEHLQLQKKALLQQMFV